jgi:hypothetical protein
MIAIFQSQAELEVVLPLPSETQIGIPLQSIDGRVAICHNFSEEDLLVLQEGNAQLAEVLPEDWQYQTVGV